MSFIDHSNGLYDSYFDKLRRDIDFISKKTSKYKSIKNKLTRMYRTLDQMETAGKRKVDYLNNKLSAITILLTYLNKVCGVTSTRIFGSFVRNLFERAFAYELDTTGYGDSENHDVDMIIFKSGDVYDKHVEKFNALITTLTVFSNLSEDVLCPISFGGYKVIRVDNKTMTDDDGVLGKTRLLDIPHYVVYLKNNTDIIKVDILAYNVHDTIEWPGDYDVNSLYIDCNGVHCTDNQNFISILSNIGKRIAMCNINFETIVKKTDGGARNDRERYLKQIVFYLNMRTKILEVGYEKIYSLHKYLVHDIETKEECPITGRSPPYIKIQMQCGDWLSLMAFSGVVGIRGSDYTESIRCPLCRGTLLPALISIPPPTIALPPIPTIALPPIPTVTKEKNSLKLPDYKKSKILMSDENKSDVALTYMGKTHADGDVLPTMSGSYGANPLIVDEVTRDRIASRLNVARRRRMAHENIASTELNETITSAVLSDDEIPAVWDSTGTIDDVAWESD